MLSKDILMALKRPITLRIRYYKRQIQFFQQKEALPLLEKTAANLSKGRFSLLTVEEVRSAIVLYYQERIKLLTKRLEGNTAIENFTCRKCKEHIIPITRLFQEPEREYCDLCEPYDTQEVKVNMTAEEPSAPPNLRTPIIMKNILTAVDADERTIQLVDYAAELASRFFAKVWILHIDTTAPGFIGYEIGPQFIKYFKPEELRQEHQHLQAFADRLNSQGIEAESLFIQGPTVKMILEEARKLQADLLIIGSHYHSFLYQAFQESTSLQLFKQSKIPLLTIPLDD
ncbi:universal stress protein [Nafulsella turpanensis]|uniref:universal stress protein n=1 Tax=Nafulsella turpanensis TaxID=1265690 RepID=UPI00036874F3|nr:universal stress protein [Nafulsella turpanensis]